MPKGSPGVPRRKRPVSERFWEKVAKGDTCWIWMGAVNANGYGHFAVSHGDIRTAHRYSYEDANGQIATGLQASHLCNHKLCVNPQHIRAVPQRENMLHFGPAADEANSRHCRNGHLLTKENVYLVDGTKRRCRRCQAEAVSRRRGKRV